MQYVSQVNTNGPDLNHPRIVLEFTLIQWLESPQLRHDSHKESQNGTILLAPKFRPLIKTWTALNHMVLTFAFMEIPIHKIVIISIHVQKKKHKHKHKRRTKRRQRERERENEHFDV